MAADLVLLLVLILLNGLFAMSEMAIVGSRRTRLTQMAATRSGAQHALSLAAEPTRFLSSVQVGITTIGILSGAIGEASIAEPLRVAMERIPVLAPHAEWLSLAVMVVALTYVSLIVGELVPKRLALTHPETIASAIARPMDLLATAARPVVQLLSLSTDGILRLFRVHQLKPPGVTVDEVRVMLAQGAEEGVFARTEHEMMTNVLSLDTRPIGAVLTRRADVVFLDVRDPMNVNRRKVRDDAHAVLPLCDGGLDRVLGFIRLTKLLDQQWEGESSDLRRLVEPPLFVPETMTLMKLLERFKRTHLPAALVVDEFGGVEGLVSLTDVIGSIVGELSADAGDESPIVRRDDGSWLVDGALDLVSLRRVLDLSSVDEEPPGHFRTLGGLVMQALGRVPRTGDVFERGGYRFEVVDMDGHRVDRVLVSRIPAALADE